MTLGAAALTVVFWASAFAGIRAGLQSYSPESVALLRYLTASICLAVYALLTRMPLPALRDVPGIALTGFLGFSFYNVALNAGEQRIPAGTASLIIASAPVFVALMAGAFYKERLRLRSWLGILLSFVGVAVISVKPQDRPADLLRRGHRPGCRGRPGGIHRLPKTFPEEILPAPVRLLCDLGGGTFPGGFHPAPGSGNAHRFR